MSSFRSRVSVLCALSFAGAAWSQPAAEPGKWSVSNPEGRASVKEAPIDVTEGTWMNVDVSPDGKEIVFDLLGDLYIMPITGGDAKAITSGVEWDMQPRFSPDGTMIAFTSDRTGEGNKGGDNIWVVQRDGSSPKQITKESFRLLNSPVWTPDGQYIAARKHFTSRRSLGAGEVWMYHRSGVAGGAADGLQLTTRPTEQKDVGEPAFSPDGRYLYYSLDATPGGSFEYSRDSGDGIYAINRLDRTKGETETILGGPGGAIRPTPSPDGKSLAFVRRMRFKTCLFVLDLASGKARPVTDQLERDMQETWAIHGVYPTMAWTPDNSSIVYWGGGKIRRVDIAKGIVTDIPFHVRTTRSVAEAVRFPVQVAPEKFDVRMLQSVCVSPKGDRVVYQALGHIYVRDLPAGTARRLTTQNDHFEFFPSFSRDGASVVYCSWNDDSLGMVRIVPSTGGEGRVISTEPGHYVDPAFTPDGKKVVFGKVSGGYLTTPIWSRDPGLYVVPATNAGSSTPIEPVRVTTKGTNAHFGSDSDRVFLMTVESQKDRDRRCLISMKLDGTDERTHLVTENATEFRVSPDGQWVAFAERFNVFITPFTATGREVNIGPGGSAQPVAKVTKDAGQNLHWSGDSTQLHWSLGPELFTRSLTDSFAFVKGAPEKLPEPGPAGMNIAFAAPYDAPKSELLITGARIITMKGDQVIEEGQIYIKANRIAAIGGKNDAIAPAGTPVFSAAGRIIMPGMIDVHAHGAQGESGITPQRNWVDHANLAFGVTTIHDPSNDTETVFAASELAKAGLITAPRIFSTGTILYGAAGSFKAEIDSLDDARFHLRRMKAVGAFSVKSYNQPRRDQRQMVIAAARELGMMVVPEGGSLIEHNLTMVVDGHTGVEHSLPVENIYSDVTQLWSASATGHTPTLIVGYGGIAGENYWYDKTNVWENTRLMQFVPRSVVDPRSRRRVKAPDEEYNTLRSARICKALVDAGVKVHLGAHGQLAGLGAQWELWMLGQGGLTPMQAIRAATIDGAFYLGLDKDIGSLEPGKLADLLILEKDPLADLSNSQTILYTMLNGRLYDARTMACLSDHPGPAPSFFFHELQGGIGMRPARCACAGCGIPGAGCRADEPVIGQVSGYR